MAVGILELPAKDFSRVCTVNHFVDAFLLYLRACVCACIDIFRVARDDRDLSGLNCRGNFEFVFQLFTAYRVNYIDNN